MAGARYGRIDLRRGGSRRATLPLRALLLGAALFAPQGLLPQVAAQAPAVASRPRSLTPPVGFLARHPALRLQIVQGRLAFMALEVFAGSEGFGQAGHDLHETLTVQVAGGAPTLSYAFGNAEREFSCEVKQGIDVRLRLRSCRGDKSLVELRQPARGELTLTLEQSGESRELRGSSLWHLLLIEPERTQAHLVPLIELLKPSVRLAQVIEEIQTELTQVVQSSSVPTRQEVERLVEQLNHPRFRERQIADRQLRNLGPGIGPHLHALSPRQLTAEQRERVGAILEGLAGPAGDTPERVAAWLAAEPLVWVEMLRDRRRERRLLAIDQLCRLTGRSWPYDPNASGEDRDRQYQATRTELLAATK